MRQFLIHLIPCLLMLLLAQTAAAGPITSLPTHDLVSATSCRYLPKNCLLVLNTYHYAQTPRRLWLPSDKFNEFTEQLNSLGQAPYLHLNPILSFQEGRLSWSFVELRYTDHQEVLFKIYPNLLRLEKKRIELFFEQVNNHFSHPSWPRLWPRLREHFVANYDGDPIRAKSMYDRHLIDRNFDYTYLTQTQALQNSLKCQDRENHSWPIEVMSLGDKLYIRSSSVEGINYLDELTHINGVLVNPETYRVHLYGAQIEGQVNLIITIKRGPAYIHFNLQKKSFHEANVSSKILQTSRGKTLWITIHSLMSEDTCSNVENEIKNNSFNSLILDLRNNPGGAIGQVQCLASLFLSPGLPIVGLRSFETLQNNPQTLNSIAFTQYSQTNWTGPMVTLINERSASGAEILAAALMDHNRSYTVGTATFGKGSYQQRISVEQTISELGMTQVSSIGLFFRPFSTSELQFPITINMQGVKPNFNVERTINLEITHPRYADLAIHPYVSTMLTHPPTTLPGYIQNCMQKDLEMRSQYLSNKLFYSYDWVLLNGIDLLKCVQSKLN